MFAVSAKPLEWKEEKTAGSHGWNDTRMGFWIDLDGDDYGREPYSAAWGEGDVETFGTLNDAKQWCQGQADSFMRDNARVEAVGG